MVPVPCSDPHTALLYHPLLFIQCCIYSGSNNNDYNDRKFLSRGEYKEKLQLREKELNRMGENAYCISENFWFKVTKNNFKQVQIMLLKSRCTEADFGLLIGHFPSNDSKRHTPKRSFPWLPCWHTVTIPLNPYIRIVQTATVLSSRLKGDLC